jgi:diguanylate cyclase (GGDEF)-like protein
MLRVVLQLGAYLIAVLVPYLMVTADSGYIHYISYFPFFSVSVLILLYYSGPVNAVIMSAFATIIGMVIFVGTIKDFSCGVPFVVLAQIGGLWFLFWASSRLIETRDVHIHRLQEQVEKLEMHFSVYQQQKQDTEKNSRGLVVRVERYAQLQALTDQLAALLQVKEVRKQTENAIGRFFSGQGETVSSLQLFNASGLPRSEDVVGNWIVKQRIPVLISDWSEDPRFPERSRDRKGSLIACPIHQEQEIVGVMQVESSEPKEWQEEDLRFLSDIANIVSLSMTNAMYYEKVESLAVKDSLTGLYARYRFDERVEQEFFRSKDRRLPLSLLILDIDHFKRVNDKWGHLLGDRVLKFIAKTIEKQTRETDFCARYGGEEFVVLMPLTTLKNAFQIAERIRMSIEEGLVEPERVKVSISGGISCVLPGTQDALELIGAADRALYRAKEHGRNRIVKG